MAVVVDTHALVWYLNDDRSLSRTAADAIAGAEADGEAIVSVASFIDAWYVSQTTGALSAEEVDHLIALVNRRHSGFRAAGITAAMGSADRRHGQDAPSRIGYERPCDSKVRSGTDGLVATNSCLSNRPLAGLTDGERVSRYDAPPYG